MRLTASAGGSEQSQAFTSWSAEMNRIRPFGRAWPRQLLVQRGFEWTCFYLECVCFDWIWRKAWGGSFFGKQTNYVPLCRLVVGSWTCPQQHSTERIFFPVERETWDMSGGPQLVLFRNHMASGLKGPCRETLSTINVLFFFSFNVEWLLHRVCVLLIRIGTRWVRPGIWMQALVRWFAIPCAAEKVPGRQELVGQVTPQRSYWTEPFAFPFRSCCLGQAVDLALFWLGWLWLFHSGFRNIIELTGHTPIHPSPSLLFSPFVLDKEAFPCYKKVVGLRFHELCAPSPTPNLVFVQSCFCFPPRIKS